jgi:hypothetical protein
MLQLSDTVERKFVDSIEISDWEIETESGWVDITHINKTVEYDVYKLNTLNCSIECADTHIVFRDDHSEVFVKDLIPGDVIIGQYDKEIVIGVTKTDRKEHMYDLSVSGNHTFFAEGLLHHNTQTTVAFLLWFTLFNEDKTCAILANKASTARQILARYKLSFEYLPDWLQQGVVEWNKGSVELGNGCRIMASSTSSSAIRGESISFLMLDEFAFVPTNIAEDFMESVYPTISSGVSSRIIITSTPNKMNHFYKLYMDAKEGRSDYVHYEATWRAVPWRDEEWMRQTIANIGEASFLQEFEGNFMGGTDTLIAPAVLATLTYQTPLVVSDIGLTVYEKPIDGHTYFMTVDTSRGTGNDYTAANVIDISSFPYKQVALFRNNSLNQYVLPEPLIEIAKQYNDAYMILELNDAGEGVANSIFFDFEYENLLWIGKKNGKFSLGSSHSALPGIRTTVSTKRSFCADFKAMVESGKLIINDFETIKEMSTFVRKGITGNRIEAEDGMHDDIVMSLAIFAWVATQDFFKELFDSNLMKNIRDEQRSLVEEELAPIGFFSHIDPEEEMVGFERADTIKPEELKTWDQV